MIHYSDIVRHENLPFEEYLNLQGHSHSFLKNARNGVKTHFDVTENVRIGAMVDHILTEPHKVDMSDELYPFCRQIAFEIRNMFGDLIDTCTKQLSYTARMHFGDLSMPVTGRLDFLLEQAAVIDLKITKSKDIDSLITFMGYENQLWHYGKLSGVKKGYLLIYSIPLRKVIVRAVNIDSEVNEFWLNKLIDFGSVEGVDTDSIRINAGLGDTDQLHY